MKAMESEREKERMDQVMSLLSVYNRGTAADEPEGLTLLVSHKMQLPMRAPSLSRHLLG